MTQLRAGPAVFPLMTHGSIERWRHSSRAHLGQHTEHGVRQRPQQLLHVRAGPEAHEERGAPSQLGAAHACRRGRHAGGVGVARAGPLCSAAQGGPAVRVRGRVRMVVLSRVGLGLGPHWGSGGSRC